MLHAKHAQLYPYPSFPHPYQESVELWSPSYFQQQGLMLLGHTRLLQNCLTERNNSQVKTRLITQ